MLKWYVYTATENEVDDSGRSAAMLVAVLGGIFAVMVVRRARKENELVRGNF
jgi:hypothetical protein